MSEESRLLMSLISGGITLIILAITYLVTAPVVNAYLNIISVYDISIPVLGSFLVTLNTVYTMFFTLLFFGTLFWLFYSVYHSEYASEGS